jgi:hypothetical protein
MTVLEALMAAGLFVAPQGPVTWPDPTECIAPTPDGKTIKCRNFNDELATIPNAFDGAMKEDRPSLNDMAKPPTTEGEEGE